MYKRISALLTLMMVAAMLLTACGSEPATSTAVPPAATNTTAAAPAAPTNTPAAAPAAPTNTAAAPAAGTGNVQIIWFAWPPCQALTDLSKTFPGGNVDV